MRLSIVRDIQRKELTLFFGSPVGYLFLAVFLGFTHFVFFWGESFFARNIADARPMFESLPILLIFLCAAITMRMWSEERRTGTLEFVATVPVSTWEFVVGKFVACWTLLALALLLTLPIPLTVAMLANLDWGPVLSGYLAAMLLGGAYIAVGLFVSARTDSQIVSLLLACVLTGLFYMVGSEQITKLFGSPVREFLGALGSGSRFESIARGVLDFRDLYFYLSILIVFLVLNVYSLERERWSVEGDANRHRNWRLGSTLAILNLLLVNVWLANFTGARLDVTQGGVYSISSATRGYLQQLQEPLLIRGYFSAKTHPELAPLVPRMQDLLREYAVAGGANVKVEMVDPITDPEMEDEANSKYGIQAVPFQVADRHTASLVNSYFDVLVAYGDQYEVLNFRDLIEVKITGDANMEVLLQNPEFEVTRAIKKVLYGFQGGSSIFDSVSEPVNFVGYISGDDVLPQPLIEARQVLETALAELQAQGGDKFTVQIVDPLAGDGQVAVDISEQFGFQPMAASLFDETRFYFYLTLQNPQTVVQIPIPQTLTSEAVQRGIEEGLKRYASGLLKSVVIAAPPVTPPYLQQQGAPPTNEYVGVQDVLINDFDVQTDDLASGVVPAQAQFLMVLDPSNLSETQVFAIDQFLMKGGTVVVSSGAFATQLSETGLVVTPRASGLSDWLAHHGVTIEQQLVMDTQNKAFPVPVPREARGFNFQGLMMIDYPFIVDVRGDGLAELPMHAGLSQVAMSWVSPLMLIPGEGVQATTLLESSAQSWLTTNTDVAPRYANGGIVPFTPTGEQSKHVLGAMLEGKFTSFFAGKPSPLLAEAQDAEPETAEAGDTSSNDASVETNLGVVSSVVERAPESARLIVYGSNDFLADLSLRMIGAADGLVYSNSLQMVGNLVDWGLEDQSLVGIRARGNFNRTLPSMALEEQRNWEYLNYLLAVLGIALVFFVFKLRANALVKVHRRWLEASA